MRYVFGIFVVIALASILDKLDNANRDAQAICELQRSADVCFQILNR